MKFNTVWVRYLKESKESKYDDDMDEYTEYLADVMTPIIHKHFQNYSDTTDDKNLENVINTEIRDTLFKNEKYILRDNTYSDIASLFHKINQEGKYLHLMVVDVDLQKIKNIRPFKVSGRIGHAMSGGKRMIGFLGIILTINTDRFDDDDIMDLDTLHDDLLSTIRHELEHFDQALEKRELEADELGKLELEDYLNDNAEMIANIKAAMLNFKKGKFSTVFDAIKDNLENLFDKDLVKYLNNKKGYKIKQGSNKELETLYKLLQNKYYNYARDKYSNISDEDFGKKIIDEL